MVSLPEPGAFIELDEPALRHRVPVYRFGSGPAPRILVTAGLHGGETTGQYAAFRLIESLAADPEVAGEVVVLPRCNPSAFRRMERTSPFDELDMNRIFPGDAEGTPTQVLASRVWDLAREADYIVDLHCAGPYATPYTLAQYSEYENCRELASLLDIPVVVQSGGSEGQLFVEAGRRGIPAVIIELPGGGPDGIIDLAAGEGTLGALRRLLTLLEVLPGEASAPSPAFCDQLVRVTAPADGLYLPRVAPGNGLGEDGIVGLLEAESVATEGRGYCIKNRPPGYVFRGDPLAAVAPAAPGEASG